MRWFFVLTQVIQNETTDEQNYDKTLFFFKLFNVELFEKKVPTEYGANFMT